MCSDRLAYTTERNNKFITIVLPATIEDGFNVYVDLLVAIDMHGKIATAIFIREIDGHELFRVAEVIKSQKVEEFSHITIRGIQRIN
tara:strand:+ start:695 stop:955 length:261 start_codon:yes stop_codon:yes gene_type:complete